MAKMFDKVSQDFLSAIKGVLEAKKVNKHGHDHPGEEDEDIDNDGDTDKSDKYLHNRRKAIGKAMMKKESAEQIDELSTKTLRSYRAKARDDAHDADAVDDDRRLRKRSMGHNTAGKKIIKRGDTLRAEEVEQIDEISAEMKSRYKKSAQRSLDQAQDFKSELDHEGEPKGSRVRKDVNRIIKNRKMGMKRANEEAETQIDEISTKTALNYMDKASDARGHRNLSTPKLDKRYKSMALAHEKIRARRAKVPTTEETALTPEEIAMIEAKMAGVAPGAMDCDKHMCATKVFHKEWAEGTPIKTMHADPDENGLIEWYDVMFDHGIERVMTEDMEILQAESHMHSKRKMKEEVEELEELSTDTMKRYQDKARTSADALRDKGFRGNAPAWKKAQNRSDSIDRAQSKIKARSTNEEVEELDELSKGTLASYAKKAMDSEKGHSRAAAGLSNSARKLASGGHTELAKDTGKAAADHMRKAMNRSTGAMKAIDKLAKEEVEQIDETAKIVAHLQKRYGDNIRKSHVRSAANDFGVGYVALAHAVRKKLGVNRLDEARGRPKKAGQKDYTVHPVTKEKMMHNNPEHMKRIEKLQKTGMLEKPKREAAQHIMNQLSKAKTSMRGGETIHFTHGESKHVSGAHAAKLISKYQAMKPAEKEDFQKKIGHSHEQLMKHV